MKLRTTFWGDDVLFEGDLSLLLRAVPAGARVTRAAVTLAPATGAKQPDQFHEVMPVKNGRGRFGIAAQPQLAQGAAIVDLGARRAVERVGANGLAAQVSVQLDLGGMWMPLDQFGNPAVPPPAGGGPFFPATNGSVTLPGLVAQRLRVGNSGHTGAIDVTGVTLLTYPSNLTLRLGTIGPFWFRTGDLREPVTTPDFADIFQGFLDRNQPIDGVFEVPFILHSDTLARLRLTLEIAYFQQQSLLPPQLSQVVLPFGYAAVPTAQPAPIAAMLPRDAQVLPAATSAVVAGRFDTSRVIHGPLARTAVQDTVRVTPQQSFAHPIRLSQSQTADAIDLHVESITRTATLLINLLTDVDGKPWEPSLLPAPIRVSLERPAAGGTLWASAPLPADFTFQADRTYWLIVNSADGEVNWAIQPAGALAPLQFTGDAGLSWRVVGAQQIAGPVAGVYRLRARLAQFSQPIKLDVGGHEVSLRSLDALGKVDFRLDLPEVAAAFNAALDDAAQQRTGLDERVANGDFARWTRIERSGRRIVAPSLYLGNNGFAQLAAAPDTAQVYIGLASFSPDRPSAIQIIANEAQPRLADAIKLPEGAGNITSLAVAPDGRRVYAAVFGNLQTTGGRSLVIVKEDLAGGTPLAMPITDPLHDGQMAHLALAPDCSRLYLATRQSAGEGDRVAALIRLDPDTLDFTESQVAKDSDVLPLGNARQQIQGLLVSPDGRRAYVAAEDGIRVADLERWQSLGQFRIEGLVGLALSCDGARLYALFARSSRSSFYVADLLVIVFDTARLEQRLDGALPSELAVEAIITPGKVSVTERQFWWPTAVTPDDTRLLIAVGPHRFAGVAEDAIEEDQLLVIDTTTNTLLQPIALPLKPRALAVTADSRRAFVLAEQTDDGLPDYGFHVLTAELDGWTADQWALTAGRAAPVCVPGSNKPSARLGALAGPTGLSQVFPVVGGQPYVLRFWARTNAPGARAELFWLSRQCGSLGELSVDVAVVPCAVGLRRHILRGTAPAGADRAELRFVQPMGGYTLLDDVSVQAPVGSVDNGTFVARAEAPRLDPLTGQPAIDDRTNQPLMIALPQGWQLTQGGLGADLVFRDAGGVRLSGPATLSQALDIAPGRPFLLEVEAFAHGELSPLGAPAVELRWTGSQAAAITYALVSQRFDITILSGTAPADATGAVLVFVQPAGGALDIVQARLSQESAVAVPVTFLSEAPGYLTVIAPIVAYDRGATRRPSVAPPLVPSPQAPAPCRPTPPDELPPLAEEPPTHGEPLPEEPLPEPGFCACCETHHVLDEPEPVVSESGMHGVAGTCPIFQAPVVIFPARPRRDGLTGG